VSGVAPVSFDDHFTQATLFWASMTQVERTHIVEAFTFELGKVYEQSVKERELAVLACVDAQLCAGGFSQPVEHQTDLALTVAELAQGVERLLSRTGHNDLVVSPVALTQLRLHASARPRVVRQQHNRLTHQPPI